MKRLLLAFMMIFCVSAFALEDSTDLYFKKGLNPFFVQPQFSIFPNQVTARVWNRWNRPIICSGVVYARNTQNMIQNAWFNQIPIYPGQYGYAYVYNYNPNQRFVHAWGNVNCRFY